MCSPQASSPWKTLNVSKKKKATKRWVRYPDGTNFYKALIVKALQDLIYSNKNMPLVISETTRAVIEWQQRIHVYSKKAQEVYLRSFTLDIPVSGRHCHRTFVIKSLLEYLQNNLLLILKKYRRRERLKWPWHLPFVRQRPQDSTLSNSLLPNFPFIKSFTWFLWLGGLL